MVEQIEKNNVNQRMIGSSQHATSATASDRAKYNNSAFVANIAEKRYLWTARAFAVVAAISICCNIVLILAIVQVIPLYRVEPFLLTFQNKNEQIYNIKTLDNLKDNKLVSEIFVRQYVLLRSTFVLDIPEMQARWLPGGPIQEMSSQGVYTDFVSKTANRALKVIKEKKLTRDIKIISVNELSNGLWQVEYETRDMYPDSPQPKLNYWTASLRIAYVNKTIKYAERLKNPIGFKVTAYSLTLNKVE